MSKFPKYDFESTIIIVYIKEWEKICGVAERKVVTIFSFGFLTYGSSGKELLKAHEIRKFMTEFWVLKLIIFICDD